MRQALTEALIEFEGALVVVCTTVICCVPPLTISTWFTIVSRTVRRRSGRLSTVVERRTKQENQTDEAPKEKENANSAQDVKIRNVGKRSCVRKPSHCVRDCPSGKRDGEAERTAGAGGEKLGDSELYDQSRKAELTASCNSKPAPNPAWKSAKWRGWSPGAA